MKSSLAGTSKLNETLEEVMRGRHGKFESENFQNQVLHTQDLLLGVRVIGDVHELGNLWRIDLFVFAVYKRDPLRSNIKRRKRDGLTKR